MDQTDDLSNDDNKIKTSEESTKKNNVEDSATGN